MKSSSKYSYSKLSECLSSIADNKSNEAYNFYAVIVDATYPHRAQNGQSNTYTCTLRLIDQNQLISDEGIIEACTLVLFSTKFEDLPISQRVGDIIRVHRATVSEFRGAKHFTANLNYNSSWALFSPCPKLSLADD